MIRQGTIGSAVDLLRPEVVSEGDEGELGFLNELLADSTVTDVLINPDGLWVDNRQGLHRVKLQFLTEAGRIRLARRLAMEAKVRLDAASPITDGVLGYAGKQLRLQAVIPPVAARGTLISLRVMSARQLEWKDLCAQGMIPPPAQAVLLEAVESRQNLLISGGTGTGKTTLLSALLTLVPTSQRIICVEQVSEITSPHPHLVRLQERAANVSGKGQIPLSELVTAAMRMRPDRIVLGECRGQEIQAVLAALNTGHEGSAATIHANHPDSVPARLIALGALAGMTPEALVSQAAAAIDLIVHLERNPHRQVAQIARLRQRGGQLAVEPQWSR
ncbi:ATPase, T2SS/T4P/T4SS family [Boudabousia marimammalium]|uniref:Bacterial type II secretion system protein E domain-containing protein n=1 Tax=Boudabousia marimammalium TaxID=156892 RepID=A0A1Q5PSS5_9ACTO|nr:ATPase, T2SS/T4P/T4SS family [Boudabousia marimammalium]OKL50637.1 hypothetical protein BM477_01410 [Boudabousia marimammalium]